jgi:hypothetical protein
MFWWLFQWVFNFTQKLCCVKVDSSCSTSDNLHVTLVKNLITNDERGKEECDYNKQICSETNIFHKMVIGEHKTF